MTLAEAYLEVTHVELTYPMGRRVMVDLQTYRDMPEEALTCVEAHLLTRREVIGRLGRRMSRKRPVRS
jgi:hypothetical protein